MEPGDTITPTAEQIQAAIENIVTTQQPDPAPQDAPPMHAIDSMAAVAAAGHAAQNKHSTKRGWFLLVVLVAACAGFGVYDRAEIVRDWPPSALIYDLAGMHVPVLGEGLTIQGLQWQVEKSEAIDEQTGDHILQKPTQMVFSGTITNTLPDPAIIPNLWLRVADPANRQVFMETIFRAHAEKILPQETIPFSIPLPVMEKTDIQISVTFTESAVVKNMVNAKPLAPPDPEPAAVVDQGTPPTEALSTEPKADIPADHVPTEAVGGQEH